LTIHGFFRWWRTPLPLKFWLFAGAAVLPVLLGSSWIYAAVERWSDWAQQPEKPALFLAAGTLMLVLGAFLVWRAVRAYPRRS
jgi:hypothetical protein